MTKTITAYKAFDKDFTCRGFKYKVGESYKHKGKIELCSSGFHVCNIPFDIFKHYSGPILEQKYATVEVSGEVKTEEEEDGSKTVASRIDITKELNLKKLIEAQVKWVKNQLPQSITAGHMVHSSTTGYLAHSTTTGDMAHSSTAEQDTHSITAGRSSHSSTAGMSSHSCTTGDLAHSSTTGYVSYSITTGKEAHSSTSGCLSQSTTTGKWSHSSTSGDCSRSSTAGDYSHAITAGEQSHASTKGEMAHAVAVGWGSDSSAQGKNSIACALGDKAMAKAPKGGWIVLADYDGGRGLVGIKSAKVDGKKIKANVFYRLKGGKFIESTQDREKGD